MVTFLHKYGKEFDETPPYACRALNTQMPPVSGKGQSSVVAYGSLEEQRYYEQYAQRATLPGGWVINAIFRPLDHGRPHLTLRSLPAEQQPIFANLRSDLLPVAVALEMMLIKFLWMRDCLFDVKCFSDADAPAEVIAFFAVGGIGIGKGGSPRPADPPCHSAANRS